MEPVPVTATTLSALHDAELYLVLMDRDQARLQLGFRCPNQTICTIIFDKIVTYKLNNIQYQNVISRAVASGIGSDFYRDIDEIIRWTCSGSSNDLLVPEKNLQRFIENVRSGELYLFYIDPSWGAEVGVLAEIISMSQNAA